MNNLRRTIPTVDRCERLLAGVERLGRPAHNRGIDQPSQFTVEND
jgi:hypothetical protein